MLSNYIISLVLNFFLNTNLKHHKVYFYPQSVLISFELKTIHVERISMTLFLNKNYNFIVTKKWQILFELIAKQNC